MHFVGLIPAALALFVSGAACAQEWDIYVNRENFFSLNLPGEPTMTEVPYKTAKGTTLNARIFTAIAPASSILAGKYTLTVVDYSNAKGEMATAIDEATKAIRAKGTVKYDGVNMLDMHKSWRLTVETPQTRILAEVLMALNNRLYISLADTALNVPPPAQFQASLQILDDKGVRIRYRTVTAATPDGSPDEVVPVTPQNTALESNRVAALIRGTWKAPAGSCEAAYFKSAERVKTKRGEEAMAGTVTNAGLTITGQLIISGPREGQLINPANDQAIFLFENQPGDKLSFSAIGAPAAGWPDVTLDLCPGSRG
jgi:hypothetical protein